MALLELSPGSQTALITAIGVVVAAIISTVIGLVVARQSARANDTKRDLDQSNRNERWSAKYRANGEAHLSWDSDRASDIRELRFLVNQLQALAKVDVTVFEPIPKAPAIFPTFEDQD